MQSFWMQMTDSAAVLELRDTPVPVAAPGQLLVRLRAASLNRGEFIAGHGLHGKPGTWKAIGQEGAGDVAAVGPDVTQFKPGDRVMGRCAGAFSEFALMEAAEAMPVPAGLSWRTPRASRWCSSSTYDMLVLQGRLQRGRDGCWSPACRPASAWPRCSSARRWAHASSAPRGRRSKLAALAAARTRCRHRTRGRRTSRPAVLEATGGQGVDLAVNTVGGSLFAESVRALAFEGRLATVGYVDGVLQADLDLEALHAKRLTLFGVSNKLRNKAQRAAAMPRFVAEVLPLFGSGRIKPQIDQVLDFAQLPAAKARMEAGAHIGKIVRAHTARLTPPNDPGDHATMPRLLRAAGRLALGVCTRPAMAQARLPDQADPPGDRLRAGRRRRLRGARDERRARARRWGSR